MILQRDARNLVRRVEDGKKICRATVGEITSRGFLSLRISVAGCGANGPAAGVCMSEMINFVFEAHGPAIRTIASRPWVRNARPGHTISSRALAPPRWSCARRSPFGCRPFQPSSRGLLEPLEDPESGEPGRGPRKVAAGHGFPPRAFGDSARTRFTPCRRELDSRRDLNGLKLSAGTTEYLGSGTDRETS